MPTVEQLVDAVIDAAYYDCEALAPARAALLAAMGGDGVAWPLGTHAHIDHAGFHGRVIGHYRRDDGYDGVVLQQDGTKVVHVYGLRHLREDGPTFDASQAVTVEFPPDAKEGDELEIVTSHDAPPYIRIVPPEEVAARKAAAEGSVPDDGHHFPNL